MRSLYALIAILFFSFYTHAQTAKTNDSGKKADIAKLEKNENAEKKKSDDKKTVQIKSGIPIPPEKAAPIKIPLIPSSPVIDGKVDEEAWKQAAVFKDFYQTSPGDNIAPSKPTEAYMMYDERHLYIAFKCWDEKDKVRATVAKRDHVFGEDNVRVWLDTYNDQRRAYILGFNPLGVQQDGIFTEGQGADFSIDLVMESKGVIEEWGWSVEVKIPFKSLRYTAGKGKMWGFNVARNIDRLNDEFDQWLPDDRNISGFLIKHGKITGLDEIKYERTLELVPSITVSETGRRKRTVPLSVAGSQGFNPIFNPVGVIDPGRFVNEPIETELGLNLKYTISPNVTLDAAINPDFAEIEADAPVVTANQRFPIFFQEKRPFFLEGAEIFQSPLQLFYSRTIVDPDIATKLTGKIGKNSFGFLVASDKAPGNYSEDERNDPAVRRRIDEFVDKDAYFGVFRLKRDIGSEHNVGFFGTMRVFPENRNFVGGFDGKFKLNAKTMTQFQILGTHSRRCFFNPGFEPVNETLQAQRNREICGGSLNGYRTGNGVGYFWNVDYTAKNWGWVVEVSGRTRDYRADAGFTRRTNTNNVYFGNRLSTNPKPEATLIRTDWRQFASFSYDWAGRSQGGNIGHNFNFALQGNLFLYAEMGFSYERIFEEEFGARRAPTRPQGTFVGDPERSTYKPYFSFNVNKTVNKQLSVYGFVGSIFNAFDYDFGSGFRYPRVSPAFLTYLNSPEYNEYLNQVYSYQQNPALPFPTAPNPPALDPGKGRQFDLEVGGEYKPLDPLRISLNYRKSSLIRNDTGREAFDTNIFTLRSTYQFTRFIFTRLRVDYNSLTSNVSGQALFGWNPSPGTAFYVGYNDNFNYNGFSPFTGQLEPQFERNSRTFFIRASYLFRKSF